MANLRAAIAREEAKASYVSEADVSDYWSDRAQQAEASAAWHKAESERLSAELAKEREYKEAFRDDLNGVRAALHAAPGETATGTAMFLRQRAEKAEAECSEQLARAESGEDRNRDLSEKLIAAHGKTHAESERAKKAEAELAKVRSFLSRAQGISETLSAEDAVNAAQGIINRDAGQFARLGYPTPMNVGKVLPLVVDELLRLRADAATPPYSPPFEGDPKACAFKPAEPKVGIVRDPVTGWTFDTMRQQFDAARTTVRVLAAELVAARQQIAGTKGFDGAAGSA